MWWILQIIGALGITTALIFARWYGMNYSGVLIPWSVKILMEIIVAYSLIKSYAIAPNFFCRGFCQLDLWHCLDF